MMSNHEARILELEKQVEALRALLDKESARIDDHRKHSLDAEGEHVAIMKMLNTHLSDHIERTAEWDNKNRDSIVDLARSIIKQDDRIRQELIRMRDVYYHVFPDRVEQDAGLIEQMEALGLKSSADAGPKKEWETYRSKPDPDAGSDKE
jgi:hypothetical protein